MESYGIIKIVVEDGRKEVIVTEVGCAYFSKLLSLPLPLGVKDVPPSIMVFEIAKEFTNKN